jgi:twinkle protein
MLYANRELGVTHFFVDSMMKVVKGDDDYNGQKDFVNEICSIAQDTGMHIHLIAHVKKKDDELSLPNKFDVKGSSSVTDLVDNVCIVWRNRVKEKKLGDPKATATDFEEARKLPDAVLSWTKQRHYDWEGKLSLWLAPGPQSFTDSYLSRPYTWEPPHVPLRTPALIVTDQGDRDEVHTAGRGEVESGSGTEPGVRIGDRQDQGEVSRIEDHVSQDW